VANAPHLNAGKLFFDWFYSKEGQTVYSKNNQSISLRKDVSQDHIPSDLRYREGMPALMASVEDLTAEKSRELLKLLKQVFGEEK
jgi:ABC-type Fe3+ transport system substrate-binding protein